MHVLCMVEVLLDSSLEEIVRLLYSCRRVQLSERNHHRFFFVSRCNLKTQSDPRFFDTCLVEDVYSKYSFDTICNLFTIFTLTISFSPNLIAQL